MSATDQVPPAARAGSSDEELAHNSIGLSQVLFQSVTLMAPAASAAIALQPSVGFAGLAAPLAAVVAFILLGTVAVSIGQLGKVYAHSGGLYAYIAHAVGPRFGFVVGWMSLVFQTFFAVLIYLTFTLFVQSTLDDKANFHIPFGWLVLFIAVLVAGTTIIGVKFSTNAGVTMGLIEIVVFAALALWLIIDGGSANTLQVFDPGQAPDGVSGVFKGSVFVILAFVGFESAAVLGEESKQPRRIIPRAIVLSAIVIGAFYLLCSYAIIVGWGPGNLDTYGTVANPWIDMSTRVWGLGWLIVFFALINSAYANCNAGVTSCSRVYYGMARAGTLLPRAMAKTHPRFKTPHIAIIVNTVIGIVIALLAGAKWGVLTGYAVTATAFVVLVIGFYMAGTVACFYEYVVKRRHKMNPILHVVFPVVGFCSLLATLYYLYNPLPPYPVRYSLWFAPAWVAIGIVVMLVLWKRDRRVVESARDMTAVFEHDKGQDWIRESGAAVKTI